MEKTKESQKLCHPIMSDGWVLMHTKKKIKFYFKNKSRFILTLRIMINDMTISDSESDSEFDELLAMFDPPPPPPPSPNILRRAFDDQALAQRLQSSIPGFSQGIPFKRTVNGRPLMPMPHQKKTFKRLYDLYQQYQIKPHRLGLRGTILSAVMGAGKTYMALSYVLSHIPRGPTHFPSLFISSKSLMDMWQLDGIEKFIEEGTLRVLWMHPNKTKLKLKSMTRQQLLEYDVVFTTYDYIRGADKRTNASNDIRVMGRPHTFGESPDRLRYLEKRTRTQANDPAAIGDMLFFKTPWPIIVTDESQTFNNYKSKTFQAMMSLYGEEHLCLTGTPVRNRDTDIWSLFRWMGYHGVKVPVTRRGSGWSLRLMDRHRLRPSVIHIPHSMLSFTMPKRQDQVYQLEPTPQEAQVNLRFLQEAEDIISKIRTQRFQAWKTTQFAQLLYIFTRLRQLSVAPYTLLDQSRPKSKSKPKTPKRKITDAQSTDEDESNESVSQRGIMGESLYQWCCDKTGPAGFGSSKIRKTIEIIHATPPQEKVLIFASFTSTLDLLRDALQVHGIPVVQLDGRTRDRPAAIRAFRAPNAKVFLITFPVGGEGLNLTCANHIILLEPWWNNAVMEQAIARAWRFGQRRTVNVHRVIMKRTIEPEIMKICSFKKNLEQAVLTGQAMKETKTTKLNLKTISRIIAMTRKSLGQINE